MAVKRGVNVAIDYLNSFFPVTLIPDKLFGRAGCEGKVSSIEKGLRRARAIGRVKVIYQKDERGEDIAHYQGVPGWVKPAEPVSTATENKAVQEKPAAPAVVPPPPVYFYEVIGVVGFSGYFMDQKVMESTLKEGTAYRLFTGTHEHPVEITKL